MPLYQINSRIMADKDGGNVYCHRIFSFLDITEF